MKRFNHGSKIRRQQRQRVPEAMRQVILEEFANGALPYDIARRYGVSQSYAATLATRRGVERKVKPEERCPYCDGILRQHALLRTKKPFDRDDARDARIRKVNEAQVQEFKAMGIEDVQAAASLFTAAASAYEPLQETALMMVPIYPVDFAIRQEVVWDTGPSLEHPTDQAYGVKVGDTVRIPAADLFPNMDTPEPLVPVYEASPVAWLPPAKPKRKLIKIHNPDKIRGRTLGRASKRGFEKGPGRAERKEQKRKYKYETAKPSADPKPAPVHADAPVAEIRRLHGRGLGLTAIAAMLRVPYRVIVEVLERKDR